MIYRPNALATTEMLREILHETSDDFPYIALESELEHYANHCSSWHWHDYFEFALVQSGEMELHTQQQKYLLSEGEGYFINSNVLHLCRVADHSSNARLRVHQFDRSLIASSSSVMRRYVQPLEGCAALGCIILTHENPSHKRILDLLESAFSAAESDADGYELAVSAQLIQAWTELYNCASPILRGAGTHSQTEASRIKQMLAYIHAHSSEAITAPMIAEAANICAREAFRCFNKVLGTTPNAYLMRHRINTAARMLIETDLPVTDVSMACGFSTPSYFCKVFTKLIGQSPRDFRKTRFSGTQK